MMKRLFSCCFAFFFLFSFCISASAFEYPEEYYEFRTELEKYWGTHATDERGVVLDGCVKMGPLWSYEYRDNTTGTFHPMTCYFATPQAGGKCGWGNMYYSTYDAMWNLLPETYVVIGSTGRQIHPGNDAGVVVTFTVPFSGTVSYFASVKAYSPGNTTDSPNGGNHVALYRNETKIWPETEEESLFYYDTTQEEPKIVMYSEFRVEAGDLLRLVVSAAPGTTNGSKGCFIVDYPHVQYISADVLPSIGPCPNYEEPSSSGTETIPASVSSESSDVLPREDESSNLKIIVPCIAAGAGVLMMVLPVLMKKRKNDS